MHTALFYSSSKKDRMKGIHLQQYYKLCWLIG